MPGACTPVCRNTPVSQSAVNSLINRITRQRRHTTMKIRTLHRLALIIALASLLAACAGDPLGSAGSGEPAAKAPKTYKQLVVGFAQIGAESGWRTANTLSIQETAQDRG